MYSGLQSDAEPEEILRAAEDDGALFCNFDDYKQWVRESIEALRRERR